MSIDPERKHTPQESPGLVDPEILTRSDVLYGLAFDVYAQFRDLSGDEYWQTPPIGVQLESDDQPSDEKHLSLGERKKGAWNQPIHLYSLDSEGEVTGVLFAFQQCNMIGFDALDGAGNSLDQENRKLARSYLSALRGKLLNSVLAPLEGFEADGFLDGIEEAEARGADAQIMAAIEVSGGPAIYGGVGFSNEYDLSQISLVDVIDTAVDEFRKLNGGHRPESGAELILKDGSREHQAPEEIWVPYYDAVARTGSVERDRVKRIVAQEQAD